MYVLSGNDQWYSTVERSDTPNTKGEIMSSAQEAIYIRQVNQTVDHITKNLDCNLQLKELSSVGGFSEYHFHRIFKHVTNETTSQFVWRTRLEHAAKVLRSDPYINVSNAAYSVGFGSLSGFSRAFSRQYGINPSEWDRKMRLIGSQPVIDSVHRHLTQGDLEHLDEQFTVKIRHLPAQRIAYIRVQRPWHQLNTWLNTPKDLIRWYLANGGKLENTLLYGMLFDDRDITPEVLHSFDWAIKIPDDWEIDHFVSIRDIPECHLAVIHCDASTTNLERDLRWQYLWRYWLPKSSYYPLDLPMMEIHHHYPFDHLGDLNLYHSEYGIPIATCFPNG